MFNEKKIQLEICKALSNGNLNVCFAVCDEDHIVVSYDARTAFIIRRDNLIFNLKALKKAEVLKNTINADDLLPIIPTDRLCKFNGILCREFECSEQVIYAQEKFIEMFKDYILYFSEKYHAFVAKTQGGAVIGFFMQMWRE